MGMMPPNPMTPGNVGQSNPTGMPSFIQQASLRIPQNPAAPTMQPMHIGQESAYEGFSSKPQEAMNTSYNESSHTGNSHMDNELMGKFHSVEDLGNILGQSEGYQDQRFAHLNMPRGGPAIKPGQIISSQYSNLIDQLGIAQVPQIGGNILNTFDEVDPRKDRRYDFAKNKKLGFLSKRSTNSRSPLN
jgi:hypothetical protein